MSENPVHYDCSCHVEEKFHCLHEQVRHGVWISKIKLYKCWGALNVTDVLTSSLFQPAFHKYIYIYMSLACMEVVW